MKQISAFLVVLIIGISIAVYMTAESQSHKDKPKTTIKNKPDCFISVSELSQYELPMSDTELCNEHFISDFSLINQLGDTVDIGLLDNKICVVDFFFVSCGSICPKMNDQLKRIHDKYIDKEKVLLLSHTVWPEMDSSEVLYSYAEAYGAKHVKWQFLTGNKIELYRMARHNYLVVPDINDTSYEHGGEADFIHTENVVLIDENKKIRGFYDGVSKKDIDRLISDIHYLIIED